ncbi:MAG TPA: hypothetical protein ACFYD4_13580 [Candidatus Wunengus sp. YC61]|uniref:hypothetical protein n=1 Tax=Candidatus Wunengus sp. YC61 TaxID=3367698 RepID=UPI004025D541
MAFQYSGEITGGLAPVRSYRASANVYQGQLLRWDVNAGGDVEPFAAAAAGPDTTSFVAGICLGPGRYPSMTSLYNATYKGDLITYDTTQATLAVNNPVGAAIAEVQMLTPNSLIRAPLVKDTIGTNPERKACTTGSTDGLTFIIATIDTTVSNYSTAYCSLGANRGEYRKITTGAAATQTVLVPFTNDIAIGDTFCVVNVGAGLAHIDLETQFQGIDTSPALTNYYVVYVHELNLEEAGREYATFRIAPRHFA